MKVDQQMGFGVSLTHSGVIPSFEREMPSRECACVTAKCRQTLLILADKNQFLKLDMAYHVRNAF